MARRRVVLLTVAVAAGAALLLLNRPGGDEPPPDPAGTGRPPAAVPPAGTPPAAIAPPPPGSTGPEAGSTDAGSTATGAATGSPAAAVPPHDESGVEGEETLDAASAAEAVEAAGRFAGHWSEPGTDWHARLADLTTPALAESLAGADPPQPAPALTGDPRVLFEAPAWARVSVPTDRGSLVLDVVEREGRWLVAAVDWRPA